MLNALFKKLNIFQRSAAVSNLRDPSPWFMQVFGAQAKSGAVVNRETSMGISAVWAAIRILSESMASLPFEIFERLPDGNTRRATNHPLYNLIHAEPSAKYTAFSFVETLQSHLCLDGNAVALIHRDNRARPVEFEIITPSDYDIVENTSGEIYYYLRDYARVVSPLEIIHIPALSYNGIRGKNPIHAHRESLGLSLGALHYGGNFYKNGAHISGVLEHPAGLSEAAATRIRGKFKTLYSGLDNTGEVMVLEEGMKFKAINLSPADALFIETRKFQVEEVARIYRVPLHMMQSLDKATFNNIETLSLEFVMHTLRPWIKRWEQEFNRKIFREDEKGRFFCRFNIDALLRGDMKSRVEYYNRMFQIGALSQNDIRRLENMNSIEGGDKYYVPLNMTDVTTITQN